LGRNFTQIDKVVTTLASSLLKLVYAMRLTRRHLSKIKTLDGWRGMGKTNLDGKV